MHECACIRLKSGASWERTCAANKGFHNLNLSIKTKKHPHSNPSNQLLILLDLQRKQTRKQGLWKAQKSLNSICLIRHTWILGILETSLCFQRSDNKLTCHLGLQIKLYPHTVPTHLHVACQQSFINTYQPTLWHSVYEESCMGMYHSICLYVLASEVLFTHRTPICLCVFKIKVLSRFGAIGQLTECFPIMHKILGTMSRAV